EMWNRRAEIEIFGTIGSIALHSDPMFAERLVQFPAFAETQREAVPAKWAWLDREIADGRPFIAGDQYSVADITAGVAAWLGAFFGADIPDSLVNVHHWLDRVQKRPSWNA
ncbi:MAG: glutathione S-transferase family protein, partial [Mesorhizobium sp.]